MIFTEKSEVTDIFFLPLVATMDLHDLDIPSEKSAVESIAD